MTIKAIETEYKGYRFRSRLEARWAVFFDAIGWAWEYEKEGFDLGKNGYYLPDFYIPHLDCYVEIKPRNGMTYMDGEKLRELSCAQPVVCFQGLPSLSWNGFYGDGGTVFCWDTTDSSGGAYQSDISFTRCEVCNNVTFSLSDKDTRLFRDRILYKDFLFDRVWNEICDPRHRDHHFVGDLVEVCDIAKFARFEYGEKGARLKPA